MSSPITRMGVAVAVLAALLLAVWQTVGHPLPVVLGTVSGVAARLEADSPTGKGLLCLVRTEKPPQARLVYLLPGQAPRALASAPDITGFALHGDRIFYLERSPNGSGALKQVPLSGGTAQTFRSDVPGPQDLMLDDQFLFWGTKRTPSGLWQKMPQIAAASPRILLKTMPFTGNVPKDLAVLGTTGARDAIRFLGSDDKNIYFMLRRVQTLREGSTLFYRIPKSGGPAERLAVVSGMQTGIYTGDSFYYTAPSEEASSPLSYASVMKLKPDGTSELLTDWLPSAGTLRQDGPLLYYQAEGGLWQIPRAFGAARQLTRLQTRLRSALILNGKLYLAYEGPSDSSLVAVYSRIPRYVKGLTP
ncbi:MAG: hypothetical protein IT210_04025 [Armatimonadetes bacterium]|nr:hypothetical protein [Armatimonadota bacterium]